MEKDFSIQDPVNGWTGLITRDATDSASTHVKLHPFLPLLLETRSMIALRVLTRPQINDKIRNGKISQLKLPYHVTFPKNKGNFLSALAYAPCPHRDGKNDHWSPDPVGDCDHIQADPIQPKWNVPGRTRPAGIGNRSCSHLKLKKVGLQVNFYKNNNIPSAPGRKRTGCGPLPATV